MNHTLSLPKGMRDFSPEVMVKRTFIIETIKSVFKKYCFMPIETPAMENISILTDKYGDEGEQLLFRILDSGNYLSNTTKDDYLKGHKHMLKSVSTKGLKYDLTVPFARFVSMNKNHIAMPFKRYQIQPVWRADRPQRGRYREFYQCDADVIGTKSLICEAEIIAMINDVFSQLGLTNYTIKINHRKILSSIAKLIDAEDKESELLIYLDKSDKIGFHKVLDQLKENGFNPNSLILLEELFSIEGSINQKLAQLFTVFGKYGINSQGLDEIKEIFKYVSLLDLKNHHGELDIMLARGLSYYTGTVFEVVVNNVKIGSVVGGGRYDHLGDNFGLKEVSGVGFSFGIDRLYECMHSLSLFKFQDFEFSKVLIVHTDQESRNYGIEVLSKLRKAGIKSEIFLELSKLKKQLSYADKKNIPYTITIGSDEINSELLSLKDMNDGIQTKLSLEKIIDKLLNIKN